MSAAKRIFRKLVFGLLVFIIALSVNITRNHKYSKSVRDSTVIELKGKNGRIIIDEEDGKKIFRIDGLPSKKIKEHRNFFEAATLPAKVKATLMEQINATFTRRKHRLQQSCGRPKAHHWTDGMQLISVPEKNLTICVIQKAASSSWHRLVYNLREPNGTWNGNGHQLNREHTKRISPDERQRLMNEKSGIRIITVRHPFARLISGWNDKLNKNHLRDSTRILSSLPGIEDYIRQSYPDDDHIIAFEDFARYLADRELKGIDVHFRTIEHLCQPCRYPYDFIAKTETSLNNLWWVLDRVGAVMPSFSKHTASGSSESDIDKGDPWEKERKVMTAFFKRLPIQTVVKLKELYFDDFRRFGYTFDLDTMTAGDIIID